MLFQAKATVKDLQRLWRTVMELEARVRSLEHSRVLDTSLPLSPGEAKARSRARKKARTNE